MRPSYYRLMLVAALAVTLVSGCDSGSDDDDSDPFVGSWEVTRVRVSGFDVTGAILAQIEAIEADFEANGAFELTVISEAGAEATRGNYTIDGSTIVFTSGAFEAPVVMEYQRDGSNRIVLSSDDAALLIELAGVDPADLGFEVTGIDITISRT